MHLVGYLYEDYHDARSLEHKVRKMSISVIHWQRVYCHSRLLTLTGKSKVQR